MPLQAVGGTMFTLSSPAALLGLVLGVPLLGYPSPSGAAESEPAVATSWKAEPRFQGIASCLEAELALSIPEGWSVMARPELTAIDAPWLRAVTTAGEPWRLTVNENRGRFAAASATQRLRDYNSLAALFRQPFLLMADSSSLRSLPLEPS